MHQFFGFSLFLSIMLIAFVQAKPTNNDYESRYERAAAECGAKYGVDHVILSPGSQSSKNNEKDPKKDACAKKCTVTKMGYLDDGVNFQESAFRADYIHLTTEHVNIFKDCVAKTAKIMAEDCANYIEVEKCINEGFSKARTEI